MARTLHRLPRCFAFVQILQHQPELLDLNVELLRRRPELHAPQLGKPGLVLFDRESGTGQFGQSQFRIARAAS